MAGLRHAPLLRDLSIALAKSKVGDRGAAALAALQESPSLCTLSLDLAHTDVGDAGSEALAAVAKAPQLHSLSVNLHCALVSPLTHPLNLPGDLAALVYQPRLHNLTLYLVHRLMARTDHWPTRACVQRVNGVVVLPIRILNYDIFGYDF